MTKKKTIQLVLTDEMKDVFASIGDPTQSATTQPQQHTRQPIKDDLLELEMAMRRSMIAAAVARRGRMLAEQPVEFDPADVIEPRADESLPIADGPDDARTYIRFKNGKLMCDKQGVPELFRYFEVAKRRLDHSGQMGQVLRLRDHVVLCKHRSPPSTRRDYDGPRRDMDGEMYGETPDDEFDML